MMNSTFFEEFFGRFPKAVMYGEEPYFRLEDVCKELKIEDQASVEATLKRAKTRVPAVLNLSIEDGIAYAPGSEPYVSEPGLYLISLLAETEASKPFVLYVMDMVIPAIRRDGMFFVR